MVRFNVLYKLRLQPAHEEGVQARTCSWPIHVAYDSVESLVHRAGVSATAGTGYEQNAGFRPWMIVDVRDDAACHVALLESVHVANGERFIAWSTECVNVEDIAASIPRLLPEANIQVQPLDPAATNPTLQADASGASEAQLRAIWAGCELRNDRMLAVAKSGVSFRPWQESVRDCVESLLSVGGVVPSRAAKL